MGQCMDKPPAPKDTSKANGPARPSNGHTSRSAGAAANVKKQHSHTAAPEDIQLRETPRSNSNPATSKCKTVWKKRAS